MLIGNVSVGIGYIYKDVRKHNRVQITSGFLTGLNLI